METALIIIGTVITTLFVIAIIGVIVEKKETNSNQLSSLDNDLDASLFNASWIEDGADYLIIDLPEKHVLGLSAWVEKILELTSSHNGAWDILIADLWPSNGRSRLIGYVQMSDVPFGRDIGFRVCANLENAGVEGDSGDDIPLVNEWLKRAVLIESTQQKLQAQSEIQPFDICLTYWGEDEGIPIKFKNI